MKLALTPSPDTARLVRAWRDAERRCGASRAPSAEHFGAVLERERVRAELRARGIVPRAWWRLRPG